jgi:outer membrane protein OmpA-like peptidoglycan-associated protein
MQVRTLFLAVGLAGTFPIGAQAASQDFGPQWWIYSITQACQMWSDGVARCFPVAVVGPAPKRSLAGLDNLGKPFAPPPAIANNPYLALTPYAAPAATTPAPNSALAMTAPAKSNFPTSTSTPPPPINGGPTPTAPTALASPAPANVAKTLPIAVASTTPVPAATTPTPITTQSVASTSYATGITGATPTPLARTASTSPTPEPPGKALPHSATPILTRAEILAHFDFDKSDLQPGTREQIDAWLATLPAGARLRVTGHADRFGTLGYNQILSRKRAENIARYLTSKSMRSNDLSILAKGETQPLVSCTGGPTSETKSCLAPNRRVEVVAE